MRIGEGGEMTGLSKAAVFPVFPAPGVRRLAAPGFVLVIAALAAGCAGTGVEVVPAVAAPATAPNAVPNTGPQAVPQAVPPADPAPASGRLEPVSGAWLAQEMRRGGLVLYFRHMRTHRDRIGFERDMLTSGRLRIEQCDTQRNLDRTGLEEAVRQADALARLGVARGPVSASRYCRAVQHAMRTAGRIDTPLDALTPPRDTAKVAELRRLLATVPAAPKAQAAPGSRWFCGNMLRIASASFSVLNACRVRSCSTRAAAGRALISSSRRLTLG
jgi:hypothetical protein